MINLDVDCIKVSWQSPLSFAFFAISRFDSEITGAVVPLKLEIHLTLPFELTRTLVLMNDSILDYSSHL